MIKIAGVIKESFTDGPGVRCVIFTQGCKHQCPNCQNPETHDFNGGYYLDNTSLLEYLNTNKLLKGVTFSGGDPMYQANECLELAKLIKETTNLDIWCYTGFTYEELLKNEETHRFMEYIDVVVDGMYIEDKRCLSLRFRGSTNQRIIDVQESMNSGKTVVLDFEK